MERPHHLNTANQSVGSKLVGAAGTAAILLLAVGGLVTALATGAILKQMQEIKATVDREAAKPKPPPPPPVDFKAPPPVSAIIPDFNVAPEPQAQAPRPQPAPPPTPRAAAVIPSDPLRAIARTHTLPPYPTISVRLNEHGTSQLEVTINTEGSVTDCKVAKTSGSDRLDGAACEFVKARWKWQPPTQQGVPHEATARVSVVWDLKDAQ